MIEESYCSFEVSKLLKEKGFDEPCFQMWECGPDKKYLFRLQSSCYQNITEEDSCLAPTHQMAMAYLREMHNFYICPKYCCFCGSKPKDRPYFKWEARILKLPSSNIIYPQPLDMCEHYETYEEAVEASLKFCLKNLI